jgi:hypothetical protein
MLGSPFSRPPRALRRPCLKLDNIALVPASLLPFKHERQAVANGLPHGSVLLCSRSGNRRQQQILQAVSRHMQANGRRVLAVSAIKREEEAAEASKQ